MKNYVAPGTLVTLYCSCEATIVMWLGAVGVHYSYVGEISRKGPTCTVGHRRGSRAVLRRRQRGGRSVIVDEAARS